MALTLEAVKGALRVTHDLDDDFIQLCLDAAEAEALSFCNLAVADRPDDAGYDMGVVLLVRGAYDAEDANEVQNYRETALRKLWPHRVGIGV